MMTTKREVVEKMCGGKGHVIIDRVIMMIMEPYARLRREM